MKSSQLDMVTHTYNANAWEGKAGGPQGVQGWPELCRKRENSQKEMVLDQSDSEQKRATPSESECLTRVKSH